MPNYIFLSHSWLTIMNHESVLGNLFGNFFLQNSQADLSPSFVMTFCQFPKIKQYKKGRKLCFILSLINTNPFHVSDHILNFVFWLNQDHQFVNNFFSFNPRAPTMLWSTLQNYTDYSSFTCKTKAI